MRLTAKALLSLLVFLVAFGSCDTDNNKINNGPLPADPNEWVCVDSLAGATLEQIDQFCQSFSNAGDPVPGFLQNPPPLSELDLKNIYDAELQAFARDRVYAAELGWVSDMNWRMTGPYVGEIGSGESFGVHPAVRIYYSPEVIDWLCNDGAGEIPDGAMIVKEMHSINEELDIALDSEGCMVINADVEPDSWTIMVKESGESHDGWYWAGYSVVQDPVTFAWEIGNPPIFDATAVTGEEFFGGEIIPSSPNPLWYPTGYVFSSTNKIPDVIFPYSEYGNYCVNCHASAVSELTFSSLDNVLTPGIEYKLFTSDEPGKTFPDELFDGLVHTPGIIALITQDSASIAGLTATRGNGEVEGYDSPFSDPLPEPTSRFLEFYNQLDEVSFPEAWMLRLPAQTYDHVVSASTGPDQFITSDQCIGCHDATYSNASFPNMILERDVNGTTELINLSPYGEWSASPMGLAGRDPIFFSQLQSETNNLPELTTCIENTCLHCHGVMGQRQLAIDTPGQDTEGCEELFAIAPPPGVPFGKPFSLDMVTQWPDSPSNKDQKYGALARDGISCTVCHHISDVDLGQEETFTGNFVTGPPDEIYGPYEDSTIVPKPMENAIGITPRFADYFVSGDAFSSDTCGSCHNILLPIITNEGEIIGASYEQTTHLEWVNSDFAPGGSDFKSCADCHMPTHYMGEDLSFKIANIESSDFAPTTNRLPDADITLTERDTFARHSLHGLNIFINQMFQQFPVILGARQIDYMTGTATVPSLITGQKSMIEMAQNETAAIKVQELEITPEGELRAVVEVVNLVGHYLPSGVGFRRIFIEFLVRDIDGNVLWASGRTNELGAILDGTTDEVLPSEEPVKFPDAPFQPHYQVITQQDQVQIYQELIKDSAGNLTTSFLRRVEDVKDNRIRPKGYNPELFITFFDSPFINALAETHGQAASDPYYTDPELTGADVIEYLVSLDEAALARVHDITVTLYKQSIPPFYLQQRFRDANRGPAEKDEIDRLYYITSHLDLDDVTDEEGRAVIRDWKFYITSDTREVEGFIP
ncbi:MAG: hypothetical protein RIG61_04960 [Deltaproteobacteria bacterium]